MVRSFGRCPCGGVCGLRAVVYVVSVRCYVVWCCGALTDFFDVPTIRHVAYLILDIDHLCIYQRCGSGYFLLEAQPTKNYCFFGLNFCSNYMLKSLISINLLFNKS